MISDLYEALLLLNNGNVSYALDDLLNISYAIENNHKKVVKDIKNYVNTKAEQHDLCPECLEELQTRTYNEPSEYFGQPVNEPIYTKYCPKCGEEL